MKRNMSFINCYVPLTNVPIALPNPIKPYDVNFCYPVKELESDRIKLTPVIPSIHGEALFEGISTYPETMCYMPFTRPTTLGGFEYFLEEYRLDPGKVMYAVLDKAKLENGFVKDALLGTVSYINSSTAFSTVEAGFIIVFPPYQRTHVHAHAVGLLLQYALDLPKDGGLGVRRVQWHAHENNKPSPRAAERLGFRMEGILRWQRPLPAEKEGSASLRDGDPLRLPGRNAAILSLCWDDWEAGGREHIRTLMARTK